MKEPDVQVQTCRILARVTGATACFPTITRDADGRVAARWVVHSTAGLLRHVIDVNFDKVVDVSVAGGRTSAQCTFSIADNWAVSRWIEHEIHGSRRAGEDPLNTDPLAVAAIERYETRSPRQSV